MVMNIDSMANVGLSILSLKYRDHVSIFVVLFIVTSMWFVLKRFLRVRRFFRFYRVI